MIASIIGIIFIIIIGLILFFILKKMLKVVFVLTALIIIALIAGAFIIYSDAKSLQDNFQSSPNLFLFAEDNNTIAGFQTIPGSEEPAPLSSSELSSYDSSRYYKTFIFNKNAFDSVQQIELDNITYTKDFILVLINSQTPVDDYIDNLLITQGVPQEQRETSKQNIKSDIEFTDTEFKGMLFSSLFSKANEEQGPVFIFKQYKNGNIEVYEETAIFRMIDFIPYSFIKNIFANATSAVKEKIR